MKTAKLLLVLISFLALPILGHAQDSIPIKLDEKAKIQLAKLEQKLEQIESEEREKLKNIIAELNAQQAKDSIYSAEDFEKIKMQNAKRTAENIANRQAIVKNKIEFLKRNGYLEDELNVANEGKNGEDGKDGERVLIFNKEFSLETKKESDKKHRQSTQRDLIFGIGLNNAIPSTGGINDSPFKVGGSRFFEIGYLWSTPLSKNNFLRLDYGFSFQFNGLKPENDQIFYENGDQTVLEDFFVEGERVRLDKNKFRQDNLIFPVHLHFNTKKSSKGDYFTRSGFNFALGGFVGINLNNIQKLKYDDLQGDRQKVKFRDDYNTNNFLYGLSAYAGFGDTALYLTYSLNPIFKDNPVELNNVQLGFRFAF